MPRPLPMSIATAMVSPIARPSPSIDAPMSPLRTRGNTATRNISIRVAPIASAPFLSSWLTVVRTDYAEATTGDVTPHGGLAATPMARLREMTGERLWMSLVRLRPKVNGL